MFAPIDIEVTRRPSGSVLLRSRRPLGPYPVELGSLLEHWASEAPERVYLAERSDDGAGWDTVTYGEALRRVRRLASGWLALGLSRDRPLAILSEPSIAHALASLGAIYAGIPVAPISPAYSTQFGDLRRLEFVLDVLRPGLVFAEHAGPYADALRTVDPAAHLAVRTGEIPGRGFLRYDELLETPLDERLPEIRAGITPDDVAKILFTSGSTGEPKGVLNTHRMLCSNQASLAALWPFLREMPPVLVDWLPWHHTFGGNHNFNLVLTHGGTFYIDDGRPIPGRFERSLRNLADVAPTLYFNVPRGHRLLVDALRADAGFATKFFSRLQLISNAGAALPRHLWEELDRLARTHGAHAVPVVGSWGSTETSPMATAVHYALDDPANIGLPGPGTELLLVPAEGKTEVRVRGPLVTPGYWRRPDLTSAAYDEEGFYRMGDALRFADPGDPERGLLFDGRVAENFKLSSGTWVDAGAVRLGLAGALAPLVEDAVVTGADRDELGALLVPNLAACRALAQDAADVLRDERVRAAVAAGLAAYNAASGGSSQRVLRVLLLEEPLSPAEGEVTDKGSINQRRVIARRAATIERLYAHPADRDVVRPATLSAAR
jgi:feruloyl-CoA synthase